MLTEVGTFLGSLAAKDPADRCALGRGNKHLGWSVRSQQLTAATSGRWAGSLTAATDNQWQLALDNLHRDRNTLRDAIAITERRRAIPTGTSVTVKGHAVAGYPTAHIRHAKGQRLDKLRARLTEAELRIETGRLYVVRGGKSLLKNRHHLNAAGLTKKGGPSSGAPVGSSSPPTARRPAHGVTRSFASTPTPANSH